jgi:translation initiation factor 5A
MSTSKTGKHGHAKVNFTGIDIFTAKKYKEIQGSTHPMLTFESEKSEWVSQRHPQPRHRSGIVRT